MKKRTTVKALSILLTLVMVLTLAPVTNNVLAASKTKTKKVTINKTVKVKTLKKIKKIKISKKSIVKITFKKKSKVFKVKGLKKGKVTVTVTFTNKKKKKYTISVKGKSVKSGQSQISDPPDTLVDGVIQLVNKERAKKGLGELKTSSNLQKVAMTRAKELKTLFSHSRPDGSLCFTALDKNNIKYLTAGENIAEGQTTPEGAMNSWMNSTGHRANILSDKFTKIGVGYFIDNGKTYWVQLFIGD